jgi:hypothetical protein
LRIATDIARIVFRDRKTARAQLHAFFERDDRIGQRIGVGARPIEQVEYEPRGGLRTDRR